MMILVVDGCAPEYLTEETAPDLFRLARENGFAKIVESQMPSVTNVNYACILSGLCPKDTGVVGNYYYDPATGGEGFIEERGFMQAETILQAYRKAGGSTALFTVKGKVLGVYGEGADIGLSAQDPDEELVKALSLPPLPPSAPPGARNGFCRRPFPAWKNTPRILCTAPIMISFFITTRPERRRRSSRSPMSTNMYAGSMSWSRNGRFILRRIPLLAIHSQADESQYRYSKDIAAIALRRI